MNRAVFVFAIVCVACALAVPIAEETIDNGPAPVALEDVAQDTTAIEAASNTELVRPKRFLLKKLALAKAGVLGLGLVLQTIKKKKKRGITRVWVCVCVIGNNSYFSSVSSFHLQCIGCCRCWFGRCCR